MCINWKWIDFSLWRHSINLFGFQVANVNRIPKPKPKIEKPPKEETVSQDNNTSTSDGTSDVPTSETEQTNDSVDSPNSKTDEESAHDELWASQSAAN